MLTKIATILVVVVLAGIVSGAVVPTISSNSTGKEPGICHLEVPTIDLISESERDGVIPKGNGTRTGFSRIQVCCSGYALQPHTAHHCIPVCDNGCEHGNCTAPNVCQCNKGHVKDAQGACVPTCPLGCAHGVCSNSGACSCNSGYQLEPTRGLYCLPHCRNGCGVGGQCTGPEICECKPGFEKSGPRGICELHCDGGCEGGDCVGPNQCRCRVGYKLSKDGRACEAECPAGCRNGICTGPAKCTCPEGWTLDKVGGGVCLAHCDQPCLNGECSAPNVCTCKTGYTKDTFAKNSNKCVAHCEGGCENGVCSGPNFCICNHGYVKQGKGSNVCIKRDRRSLYFELIPEQHDM